MHRRSSAEGTYPVVDGSRRGVAEVVAFVLGDRQGFERLCRGREEGRGGRGPSDAERSGAGGGRVVESIEGLAVTLGRRGTGETRRRRRSFNLFFVRSRYEKIENLGAQDNRPGLLLV